MVRVKRRIALRIRLSLQFNGGKKMNLIIFSEDFSRMFRWELQMREKEGYLLSQIAQITDWHMADEVKNILSFEDYYSFDFYLKELDLVIQALLAGVQEDKLLSFIKNRNWFVDIEKFIEEQRVRAMEIESLWIYEQIESIKNQIQKVIKLINEIEEQNRAGLHKKCSSTKSRIWHHAKSLLKYKRYELRIYRSQLMAAVLDSAI